MTWQGCHAGRWTRGHRWYYCVHPATENSLELKVEGAGPDEPPEVIRVQVCTRHKAAIEATPSAWSIDTDDARDERPKVFATRSRT